MKINNLMWSDVKIEHITSKKQFKNKVDTMNMAHIIYEDNSISLVEYDSSHWSTGKSHLYSKPKLIKITPWMIEFEAEWWGTKFNLKGRDTHYKNHKVKITANF